jgi:hypothetical protein
MTRTFRWTEIEDKKVVKNGLGHQSRDQQNFEVLICFLLRTSKLFLIFLAD